MTDSKGTPITDVRAGFKRDIAPQVGGGVARAMRRMAASTTDKSGLTFGDWLTRYYALGGSLWASGVTPMHTIDYERKYAMPDDSRNATRGTVHVCSHTGSKGQRQACNGGHGDKGEPCTFQFISAGDGIRRWKTGDGAYDSMTGSADTIKKDAHERILTALHGLARFSAEDMLATPAIAQCITLGLVSEADVKRIAGKASAPKKAPVSRVKKVQKVKEEVTSAE